MKLLADFFPILLFFVAYKLYGIYVATAVAIAASVIQVATSWYRHHRVEKMHLVTLGLLAVFGGLTIALQDRTFIMWKPSIVNWLFAAVFLGSHFIGDKPLVQRMMSHAIEVPRPVWSRLNQLWVLFFIALGAANLYVASDFFVVEARLQAAAGVQGIDLTQCAELFQDATLALCREAQQLEESWVNFKLFGMLGLTVVFIIGQAFYLARHVKDEEEAEQN
jgi:intracellular septation protein